MPTYARLLSGDHQAENCRPQEL